MKVDDIQDTSTHQDDANDIDGQLCPDEGFEPGRPGAEQQTVIQNNVTGVDHEWQTVRKRRRSKGIIGSRTETRSCIKGVIKRAFLHVSKLNPHVTVDDLKAHLTDIGIEEAQVEKLNSKYPAYYSSFKVTIPYNKLDIANHSGAWPQETRVQRFNFFRGRNSITSN